MKQLNYFILLFIAQIAFAQPGTLDLSFDPGTGIESPTDRILATAIQSDGKVIIGGLFNNYNGVYRPNLLRLNSNGSIDTTFQCTGTNSFVNAIAIQSDGKILVGGEFTLLNGVAVSKIARVNSNGTIDSTFNMLAFAPASTRILAIDIQSDGKILVGGSFSSYNASPLNRIARLQSNGFEDPSFASGVGTGVNDLVKSIQVLDDGKILIAGAFDMCHGVSRSRIAKLNASGSLDTTFVPGTGANSDIEVLRVQNDGKILVGGFFTDYAGSGISYFARLDSTGLLDGDFTVGNAASTLNNLVTAIEVQADGKILIGGLFTTYNGESVRRFTRLNPSDGSLDTAFVSGAGTSSSFSVYSISIQNDNKIIIAGTGAMPSSNPNYNGTSRSAIARVNGTTIVHIETTDFSNIITAYPNPTKEAFTLDLGQVESDFTVQLFNLQGQLISTKQYNNMQKVQIEIEAGTGLYFVDVKNTKGQHARLKVVKQ